MILSEAFFRLPAFASIPVRPVRRVLSYRLTVKNASLLTGLPRSQPSTINFQPSTFLIPHQNPPKHDQCGCRVFHHRCWYGRPSRSFVGLNLPLETSWEYGREPLFFLLHWVGCRLLCFDPDRPCDLVSGRSAINVPGAGSIKVIAELI